MATVCTVDLVVGLGFGRLLPMFKHGCTTSAADLQRKMQCFTMTWSKVLLALTLVCSLRLSPVAAAECDVSNSVQCDRRYSEGNCTFRDCTDLDNSVNVSFSACLVQRESSAASVRTYTKVSCKCPSGEITVRVELPNGKEATYRQLDTTPDPLLLNATRCDNRIDDTEPYSFCIEFADLTMVEDINATTLVSEVTVGVAVNSSQACIIIGFPARNTPTSPPTGANSGVPTPKTVTLFVPLFGAYILVKLLDGSHFFTT